MGAREEELLRQQVMEIQQLEGLQRELEADASNLRIEEIESCQHCAGSTGSATTAAPCTSSTDGELDGPMGLEDVKRHLEAAQSLRHRLHELEGALDEKEDQVARLSGEIRLKY